MALHTITNGTFSDASDVNQFYALLTGGDTVAVTLGDASATANRGTLSVGTGPWNGVSTGFFTGSASGTLIAGNAVSGYAGNLLDLQVAGVSKFTVSSAGALTTAPLVQSGPSNRSITDGGTTNTSTTLTSTSQAAFTSRDVARYVAGTGIPPATYITSVQSATSATMSKAATATNSGLSVTIYQASFTVQTNGPVPMVQVLGATSTPVLLVNGNFAGGSGAIPNPTYAFDLRSTGTTDIAAFWGTPSHGALQLVAKGAVDEGVIGTTNASKLSLQTAAVTYLQVGLDGSIGLGAATQQGSGTGPMVFIANDTADPTANPTGGGILYVSSGALKYRGSSGTVTAIAPA